MCPSGSSRSPQAEVAFGLDYRPAFEVLDADRDGRISREDLRSFYAGLTEAGAADEDPIGSMMSVADSNRDGFVEYEEFERVLNGRDGEGRQGGRRRRRRRGVMEDAFRVMDRDGDGMLSFDDIKSYMGWAGFSTSDEDIKAMIRLGGGDEKRGITLQGLLKILALDSSF